MMDGTMCECCEEAEFKESIRSLQDLMKEYAGNRGEANVGHRRLWDVDTQAASPDVVSMSEGRARWMDKKR